LHLADVCKLSNFNYFVHMLIDTHAHVNFHAFKDDAKDVLQRALDSGVQVINVGSQIDTSRECVELANRFETGIYAVVGLHPEHTHEQVVDEEDAHFKTREEIFDYEMYRELAKDPKVVGIGECGLDYYRMPLDSPPNGGSLGTSADGLSPSLIDQIKEKQKAAFRLQVKLAKELNKVLVIHSRPEKGSNELFDDVLKILDEELISTTPSRKSGTPLLFQEGNAPQLSQNNRGLSAEALAKEEASPPNIGGVPRAAGGGGIKFEVHSFTGSLEYLQKFLDRGAYVSFNGIITFDKTGNMEKLVKMTPLDRLILETDCPFLAPIPNRGKRNEPSFVKFVADKVALIKSKSVEEIAEITTTNSKRLFKI
jgi:TatD DNase family protein